MSNSNQRACEQCGKVARRMHYVSGGVLVKRLCPECKDKRDEQNKKEGNK